MQDQDKALRLGLGERDGILEALLGASRSQQGRASDL